MVQRTACRMTLAIGALALVACATPASAQQRGAVVSGRVVEAKTAVPIDLAQVTVEGTRIFALADSTGRYRLVGVPPGPQVLLVQRLGYADSRVPITVPPLGTVIQDIEMAVSALELEGLIVTADPSGRARGELGTASVVDQGCGRQPDGGQPGRCAGAHPGRAAQAAEPGRRAADRAAQRSDEYVGCAHSGWAVGARPGLVRHAHHFGRGARLQQREPADHGLARRAARGLERGGRNRFAADTGLDPGAGGGDPRGSVGALRRPDAGRHRRGHTGRRRGADGQRPLGRAASGGQPGGRASAGLPAVGEREL